MTRGSIGDFFLTLTSSSGGFSSYKLFFIIFLILLSLTNLLFFSSIVMELLFRHSGGIFVGSWPCGVVNCFDELWGSEGKAQVCFLVYQGIFSFVSCRSLLL